MKNLLTLVVIATITSLPCFAVHFDGGAGSGNRNWNAALNWSDDNVPTSATDVQALDVAIGYGVEVNNPGAQAKYVDCGTWTWPGKLTVNSGGTLTVAENFFVAQDVGVASVATNNGQLSVTASVNMQGGIGTFVNNGTLTAVDIILGNVATSTCVVENTGTINISGWVYLSLLGQNSTFNMNGGNLTAANLQMPAGGAGHLNLNGGVWTNTATLGLNGDGNYTIEVDNGVMYSAGDHTNGMSWMISVGLITGSGSKTAVCDYDGSYTKLWAIPEPATIGSIAILGLAFLRRK